MSAGATGAIGPVSVRYAAQIRDLLYAQAMQRLAAEQEAARAAASAEREARAQAIAKAKDVEPLNAKIDAPEHAGLPGPVKAPEAIAPETKAPTAKAGAATGKLVDIQA